MSKQSFREKTSPEVIRQYIKQQTCWICGRGGWKALSQHLVKAHGLPAAEVREMAYMLKRDRLISEELSESLSRVALIKFGKRRHIPLRGEKQNKRALSTKAKDILKKRVDIIRPLADIAQSKRRKPHNCKVCGKVVKTSLPRYCSPECSHIAWSEAAKKAMTPERIAFFKTVLYKPTPEDQSRIAKQYWEKVKSWPLEKQREYYLKNALSRRRRVTRTCLICEKTFDIIPSQVDKIVTCRSNKCTREVYRLRSLGRKHTAESIAKMSAHAKARHINEPRFGWRGR